MKIAEEIKDAARKTANVVTDTVEKAINKPKSPKELATRFLEHLKHEEYEAIVNIIDEEAKKYVSKIGLDNVTIVSNQLEKLKESMLETAKSAKNKDYEQIAERLKGLEKLIPEELEGKAEIFKLTKDFLHKLSKSLKECVKKSKELGAQEADFSPLQEVCEEYFNKLIS